MSRTATPLFGTSGNPAGTDDGRTLLDSISSRWAGEAINAERTLAAIANFFHHRTREHLVAGAWTSTAFDLVESEIGAALTLTRSQAGKRITLALALNTRLHLTRAAMARGEIDLHRVELIEAGLANVADNLIEQAERAALEAILAAPEPGRTALTGRRLRDAIDAIVDRIDPDGVRNRRRRAVDERFLGVSADADGMSKVYGSIRAEHGRALDGRLRELALSVCRHDSRTIDQRRADALTVLVEGGSVLPCDCGRHDCPQQTAPPTSPRKPLVHLIMTDQPGQPAYLDGHGIVDSEHAKEIAEDADVRVVQIPDEAPEDGDRADRGTASDRTKAALTYRPGAALAEWIRALSGSCHWLHCDVAAWNCDIDHDQPFNHQDPSQGGKTVASNLSPPCRHHHRLKHSGDWGHRLNPDRSVTLTAPTGHVYTTRPAGLFSTTDVPSPPSCGRKRRSRLENRAARVKAERKRQHTLNELRNQKRTQLKERLARQQTEAGRTQPRPLDFGDEPPPF